MKKEQAKKYLRLICLFIFLGVLAVNCRRADLIPTANIQGQIDNDFNVKTYIYHSDHRKKNVIWLTDCEYGFYEEIKIPGMPGTVEEDYSDNRIYTRALCLQGLCLTKEYAMMTAYSQENDIDSALIVMDRATGRHLATFRMDSLSHVGEIAYDGEYLWICNSYDRTLSRIPYARIVSAVMEKSADTADLSDCVETFSVENIPSCVAYYGGYLWVGTHSRYFFSRMSVYAYENGREKLIKICDYTIPPKVQGIAFDHSGKIFFSTSYGRRHSSAILIYHSLRDLKQNAEDPLLEIELPPCAEGISLEGNSAYVLFESANEKYYKGTDGGGVSLSPLDKILIIQNIEDRFN